MESSNKSAALESPSAQMGHLPGQVPHQAPQVPRQTPIPVPVTGISHLPNVATPHSAPQSRPLPAKYDARNVTFQHIQDIPQDLLMAVALCYKFHKVVCRQCFFSSGCTQLTAMQNQSLCLEGHHWRPLIIMPGCRLCLNFTTSWHIPVLPIPKHMKDATSPFCICKKEDHQQCYQMSKSTNPWFPHTVEELVIWTVERERCTCIATMHVHVLFVWSVVSLLPSYFCVLCTCNSMYMFKQCIPAGCTLLLYTKLNSPVYLVCDALVALYCICDSSPAS